MSFRQCSFPFPRRLWLSCLQSSDQLRATDQSLQALPQDVEAASLDILRAPLIMNPAIQPTRQCGMGQAMQSVVSGMWSLHSQGAWGRGTEYSRLVGQNVGVAGRNFRKEIMLRNLKIVTLTKNLVLGGSWAQVALFTIQVPKDASVYTSVQEGHLGISL